MFIRLAIAGVVAVIISGFYQGYSSGGSVYSIDLTTMLSFIAATVISVLLASIQFNKQDEIAEAHPQKAKKTANNSSADLPREEGVVKWFNVSKGFGFITRGNGEELFVHYRSIRDSGQNHGRRRLFENQVVTYAVVDSHKGLQADSVDVVQ